ncbi:MAG: hypothetical protein Q4E76_00090 [Tissierellia bacterium]|nr:hypothetical protein [Tissierellia bacterium]
MEYSLSALKQSLTHRFLYLNDSDALQILLNVHNVEDHVENIFPSYLSLKALSEDIVKLLKKRQERVLIANSLASFIHDDVNRLELTIYIDGYISGFNARHRANELEVLALKYFEVEELYNRNSLFSFVSMEEDLLAFQRKCFDPFREFGHVKMKIKERIQKFDRRVLRKKINKLNYYVDRQLVLNTKEPWDGRLFEVENCISDQELYLINKKLKLFLLKDGLRLYRQAYWNGLNDLVLKRYRG